MDGLLLLHASEDERKDNEEGRYEREKEEYIQHQSHCHEGPEEIPPEPDAPQYARDQPNDIDRA